MENNLFLQETYEMQLLLVKAFLKVLRYQE